MKALILCGGSGNRLFPLSTENNPKQFIKLVDGETLFLKALKRSLALVKSPEDIVILTNSNYKNHIYREIDKLGLADEIRVIYEPVRRNTAAAIALGLKFLMEKSNISEPVIVMPADHIIQPTEQFVTYVKSAEEIAQDGYIVTFGVRPSRPEAGYGYIEAGEKLRESAYKVVKFHEKPDFQTAQKYLLSGNFFWNSGIFVFSPDIMLEELKKYCQNIYTSLMEYDLEGFLHKFHKLPDISIDFAIMEKTNRAVVIPMDLTWSDVGSWESFHDISPKDTKGNAKFGNVIEIDTENTLVLDSSGKKTVMVLGIKDTIVVETDEYLLVLKKGYGQKIKDILHRIETELSE
ncbi:MAG: mannose-1-phosphate guanylyltransferase [Aquificae bacterium]|nr:mannose-1-phosphate guanylyltransferase [Aquificota bacterium]